VVGWAAYVGVRVVGVWPLNEAAREAPRQHNKTGEWIDRSNLCEKAKRERQKEGEEGDRKKRTASVQIWQRGKGRTRAREKKKVAEMDCRE